LRKTSEKFPDSGWLSRSRRHSPSTSAAARVSAVIQAAQTPSFFTQQRRQASLLEVMVACERFLDAVMLHHDEADAIGQRPILVKPPAKKSDALAK